MIRRPLCIAVDFDGILTKANRCPWPQIGPLRPWMLWLVRFMQRCGHYTVLNTCRSGNQLSKAMCVLADHHLVFDRYNENLDILIERFGGDARKISADYYIDDKACLFPTLWTIYVAFMCWKRSPNPYRRLFREYSEED